MMSADSWTLKVDLAGDVRRLKDWNSTGQEPTVASAREAIQQLYQLSAEEVVALSLKYTDNEGDQCTLTQDTLPDALSLASESHVLRLVAQRSGSPLEEQINRIQQYLREGSQQVHCNVRRRSEILRQDLQEGIAHLQTSTAPWRQTVVERVTGVREAAASARDRASQRAADSSSPELISVVSQGAQRIQELAHEAMGVARARVSGIVGAPPASTAEPAAPPAAATVESNAADDTTASNTSPGPVFQAEETH